MIDSFSKILGPLGIRSRFKILLTLYLQLTTVNSLLFLWLVDDSEHQPSYGIYGAHAPHYVAFSTLWTFAKPGHRRIQASMRVVSIKEGHAYEGMSQDETEASFRLLFIRGLL